MITMLNSYTDIPSDEYKYIFIMHIEPYPFENNASFQFGDSEIKVPARKVLVFKDIPSSTFSNFTNILITIYGIVEAEEGI